MKSSNYHLLASTFVLRDIIVQKCNLLAIEVETKFEYNAKVHEQSFSNLNDV